MNPQTIVINNFTGRLTRQVNGDLNSGFAKFNNSFGYDPFSSPTDLKWFEIPANISGTSDLVLDGKLRFLGETDPMVYAIGSSGKLYKTQVLSSSNNAVHSVIAVHSVLAGSATYAKGASMEFFGNTPKIYIGNDGQVNSINFDGTADAVVGSAGNYASGVFRPLKKFIGKLIFANAVTVGAIDASGTVTSSVLGTSIGNTYSELEPSIPASERLHDLDVSTDNNYLLLSASEYDYETLNDTGTTRRTNTLPALSNLYRWNGIDKATTAATQIPGNAVKALQTYLQQNLFFSADSTGAALSTDTEKLVTLPGNKSPFPNAVGVNGNFLFWANPENTPRSIDTSNNDSLKLAVYYFGSMDQESPPGLWRVMRRSAAGLIGGNVLQVPYFALVSNAYSDVGSNLSSVISTGVGTHYYSTHEVSQSNGSVLGFRCFNLPPTGSGTPLPGVYETQTQLFSKKQVVKQVRVYTEPTTSGVVFSLDIIDTTGVIATGGEFSYTFATATADSPTDLSGSLERINFNPAMAPMFGFAIRISNNGATHFTVKKIEVDIEESGK